MCVCVCNTIVDCFKSKIKFPCQLINSYHCVCRLNNSLCSSSVFSFGLSFAIDINIPALVDHFMAYSIIISSSNDAFRVLICDSYLNCKLKSYLHCSPALSLSLSGQPRFMILTCRAFLER